jgi:hypothetical protein
MGDVGLAAALAGVFVRPHANTHHAFNFATGRRIKDTEH